MTIDIEVPSILPLFTSNRN